MTHSLSAPDVPPQVVRFDGNVPVVRIPAHLQFEEIRDWLRTRLPEYLDQMAGRASRLDLGSREIRLFDLRRTLTFLRDQFEVEITGLYVEEAHILRYAERELKLKLFPVVHGNEETPSPAEVAASYAGDSTLTEDIDEARPQTEDQGPDTAEEELKASDVADAESVPEDDMAPQVELPPEVEAGANVIATEAVDQAAPALLDGGVGAGGERTLTLHRTLRSGAVVRYDGDVTLFGDVNPGAQILASGNITVLGTVKGMAHAGASGDEDAFIFAFDLRPTQLRVGRKIAIVPGAKLGSSGIQPEIARVEDGKIVIEPYKSGSSR